MTAAVTVQAANWYQVDMIVFEHLNTTNIDESWDADPGVPEVMNSIPLVSDGETTSESLTPFRLLPRSRQRIPGVFASLRNSSQYRPFSYLVWQQPELKYQRAKDVRILLNSNSAPANHFNVVGNVKVRSGQLLHVELDLAYFFEARDYSNLFYDLDDGLQLSEAKQLDIVVTEALDIDAVEEENRYTRIKETRRVKLNEMHYFDHPLFGVIIRVSRIGDRKD